MARVIFSAMSEMMKYSFSVFMSVMVLRIYIGFNDRIRLNRRYNFLKIFRSGFTLAYVCSPITSEDI